MCDDCTDRAGERYYSLLEKITAVVADWEVGKLDNGFAMELVRKIAESEEAE